MFENLHKISLISIEKAPVTQPNIYSLGQHKGLHGLLRTPIFDLMGLFVCLFVCVGPRTP